MVLRLKVIYPAQKGVWTTHSGQYTIPEGQYETRFFFMAVSTYNNENYIGNHIDNVWFSQQIPPASSEKPYFTLTKRVEGACRRMTCSCYPES